MSDGYVIVPVNNDQYFSIEVFTDGIFVYLYSRL